MSDTLAALATHTIEIKHSRFIAHAAPVDSPQAALEFLGAVADADATHNCWAYRIGSEYRSSDGACPEQGRRGEPAGTAGRPILAAIEGQACDRVMVVVTRWYGGIKLGAGGLVRAYGGAAAECLRQAERRPLVAMQALTVHCGFDDLGSVHAALVAHGAEKEQGRFTETGATLHLLLPSSQVDALKTQLRDATRNRVRFAESESE